MHAEPITLATFAALAMMFGGMAVGYLAGSYGRRSEARAMRAELARACEIMRDVRIFGRAVNMPHTVLTSAAKFLRDND